MALVSSMRSCVGLCEALAGNRRSGCATNWRHRTHPPPTACRSLRARVCWQAPVRTLHQRRVFTWRQQDSGQASEVPEVPGKHHHAHERLPRHERGQLYRWGRLKRAVSLWRGFGCLHAWLTCMPPAAAYEF